MGYSMKRLCTICARGGSKGLPNKNIRQMIGKPLIAHCILQAKSSGLFEAIAVSSDSKEILDISKKFGADYSVFRPKELASDTAPKLPAIQHCVNEVEILSGKKFDVIVGMFHDQVLSPFKALFKFNAINITLGLKYLRVSPDHGVAKNIIGKNKADTTSLLQCINFINKFGK